MADRLAADDAADAVRLSAERAPGGQPAPLPVATPEPERPVHQAVPPSQRLAQGLAQGPSAKGLAQELAQELAQGLAVRAAPDGPPEPDLPAAVQALLAQQRLDQAARLVSALLDARVAAGDRDLDAARVLLDHCYALVASLPPLGHIETLPLRHADTLYACFDQFLDVMRRQDGQIRELLAIVDELA